MKVSILILITFCGVLAGPLQATADDEVKSVLTNMTHVERWNRFADKLLELHNKIISQHKIRTTAYFFANAKVTRERLRELCGPTG